MREQQIPLQPSHPFAHGYLAASSHQRQPLCGNSEGWGPLSPGRFDFTPCFLDVWIAVVAIGGILGGAGAAWYLRRNGTPQPVKKNWHFYAKLVRIRRPERTGGVVELTRLHRSLLVPSLLRLRCKPHFRSNITRTSGPATSGSGRP
jgi:hypothetical protein